MVDFEKLNRKLAAKKDYPILAYFTWRHLPPHLAAISESFEKMAYDLAGGVPRCAESSAGLRKLLEAKDCFVRAALDGGDR